MSETKDATLPFHNRIALIFDFDETLAEDSFGALLRHLDQDPDAFEKKHVTPLTEAGWEKQLARAHALTEFSNTKQAISRDTLAQVGQNIELFEDVQQMFQRVRDEAEAVLADITLEFYLVSGGFVDIMRSTSIAKEFEALYGCEFHYQDDVISYPKKILPNAQKARYLRQFSQGKSEQHGEPGDPERDVDIDELHVPFSQMIYVGDGASDMKAFGLLSESGGVAIGIHESESGQWSHRDEMRSDRRVDNLAPASYAEGTELMQSLRLAVGAIARRVALRKLGQGE